MCLSESDVQRAAPLKETSGASSAPALQFWWISLHGQSLDWHCGADREHLNHYPYRLVVRRHVAGDRRGADTLPVIDPRAGARRPPDAAGSPGGVRRRADGREGEARRARCGAAAAGRRRTRVPRPAGGLRADAPWRRAVRRHGRRRQARPHRAAQREQFHLARQRRGLRQERRGPYRGRRADRRHDHAGRQRGAHLRHLPAADQPTARSRCGRSTKAGSPPTTRRAASSCARRPRRRPHRAAASTRRPPWRQPTPAPPSTS